MEADPGERNGIRKTFLPVCYWRARKDNTICPSSLDAEFDAVHTFAAVRQMTPRPSGHAADPWHRGNGTAPNTEGMSFPWPASNRSTVAISKP